jgi:hypothetical protein
MEATSHFAARGDEKRRRSEDTSRSSKGLRPLHSLLFLGIPLYTCLSHDIHFVFYKTQVYLLKFVFPAALGL